jgi:drug/metabolite transporter superfamily protein YnfA
MDRMTEKTLHRIATVAAAPAAALLGWVVIRLAGIELVVSDPTGTVGPGDVFIAALAAALGGWFVVRWLERRSRRARQWWPLIGSAALSLSVIGPSRLADDASAAVALTGLHFVTAIVVIAGLARTLPCTPSRLPARDAPR